MNILLTNDDGYDSYGIKLLKNKLEKYGAVLIVAPDSPRSGNSAALTILDPLRLEKVEKNVYKCSGTPVDCVSMGLCCFNIKFDLVVSGCNDGWNISYDTMYSGTVGAALESLIFGIPSIAFSAPRGDFSNIENHFDEVFAYIMKKKLYSDKFLLNVNFPKGKYKGFALGTLYYRKDENYFTKDKNGNFFAFRHMQEDFSDDKQSDCYQVEHGIASIVPLSRSYYSPEILKELESK